MPNELQSSQLTALVEHHTGGTMKCRTTALLPSVFSPVRQNFYLYFWFIFSFLSVCLLLYFSVRQKWTSALLEWEELSLRRGAAVLAETFPLSADSSADPQPCHPTLIGRQRGGTWAVNMQCSDPSSVSWEWEHPPQCHLWIAAGCRHTSVFGMGVSVFYKPYFIVLKL